jgi:hypothetical protein
MSANDYLEKLRQQAMAALDSGPRKYTSENEWVPTDIPTRVRFLPLPEKEGKLNFPYMTHTYHYLQGGRDDGKDIKLFVPKKVTKDNTLVEDPIDVFVRKLYDTKIESETKIAASLKRKRAFYFNAIIYEEGVSPQLKIIVDTSGEGKLARRICSVMGIPFCKDIDDRWFPDKDFQYDPDKPYFNLIDISSGYDFKQQGVTFTQLRFERDLESWRMSFNWVPFGTTTHWGFFIGISSGMLSDIKYDKRQLPDRVFQ